MEKPITIEAHEQKEGMTGFFTIKMPTGPRGCSDRCDYTTCDPQQEVVETLQARNQILEDHARQLERDFSDYKVTTEARFDKLAGLVQSLIKKG